MGDGHLPQLKTIEWHLSEIGYREPGGSTVLDYEFLVNRDQTWQASLMAFGDARRFDISTACIAVQWWPNGGDKRRALQNLRHIGAPIALFASPDRIEVWPISTAEEAVALPTEILRYDRLAEYFVDHRRDLTPHSILEAKRGERQLTFFEIDPSLEAFARHVTQQTLTEQFTETMATVPTRIRQTYPQSLTRVAISVLAARILQDKLREYQDLQVRDVERLLSALRYHFPNYFTDLNADINKVGRDTLTLLYEGLLEGFTFRSLTNDMLAYFYENVFVDEQLRRKLGIHYTPRYLTERILKHLPIEDIPPEERVVLDGTSGSGNMLLAAYDRLNKLLPIRWSLEERHNYLLEHILGIDIDGFACEIARLSLLLYDLPMGDSWQVENEDALNIAPERFFGKIPRIVVNNPPFREPRSTNGKRVQLAGRFLRQYLDWLPEDGFLGIVMPLTFLNNVSALNERYRLLTGCDILEIWHLFQGAVSHWSEATAIILARKLSKKEINTGRNLTRVIEVIGTDGKKFEQTDEPTFSYVVPQSRWLEHPGYSMDSSIIDPICHRISQEFSPIHDKFAALWNGMQPGKKARKTHFSKIEQGDINRKTLYNNTKGNILEPYRIDWQSQSLRYVRYPGDLHRSRDVKHFEFPTKVILNATRNAGGPWRFYAAIDKDKLIPTENFHYALPTDKSSAEEIAAVLNSPFANAWFARQFQGRDVNLKIVKKLPFPRFNTAQKERIHYLVNSITEHKKNLQTVNLADVRSHILELDEIIFDAYELSQGERRQLLAWMGTFPRPRPGVEWKKQPRDRAEPEKAPYRGRRWILTGEVMAVNLEKETLFIQIEGREAEIPISPTMPGWVLRPNVAFEASVPWHQADNEDLSRMTWLDFEPLGYDYLTDEELLVNLIGNLATE